MATERYLEWGHLHTEAAIYAEGTDFTADELTAQYRSYIADCDESGECADSPQRFFEQAIEGHETELQPHEIKREIDERIAVESQAWWNGASRELQNEFVIIAQREGIDAAVTAINECAAIDPNS